jgi:hypothetical protein
MVSTLTASFHLTYRDSRISSRTADQVQCFSPEFNLISELLPDNRGVPQEGQDMTTYDPVMTGKYWNTDQQIP